MSTTQADAALRTGATDVLQLIAEGVTALAGFEVAAISVVEGDELRTVAVAGSEEAASTLTELRAPVASVLAELDPAEDWGRLRFLPFDRASGHLEGFQWVPDLDAGDDPDAWHPDDLLCALLCDSQGRLRGLLSMDVPRNGRRPGDAQREVLDVYARQAEDAVVALAEHRELARDLELERGISRYRAQLVDVLSHELRTPTTVILGRAEMALEACTDPDLQVSLEAILRGARRISAMADDLLLMARVDSHDHPLDSVPVDLGDVARSAHQMLADEAGRRRVTLRLALPDQPVTLHGSPGELGTLVTNLVSNAVKYSEVEGHVTTRIERVGPGQVALVVSDDGIGVSDVDRSRLFEEFYRSSAPGVRARPGNGLGLAIVDRIVRRHRGQIEISSTLGVGTTVRITLPV